MNWKRILLGKINLYYDKDSKFFNFGFSKYWSGRLIYIDVSKITFVIDCRLNWLGDMVTGKPA